jgi:hypothetical protein
MIIEIDLQVDSSTRMYNMIEPEISNTVNGVVYE